MVGTEVLTPPQVAFYETFGFLRIPGLFHEEIGDLTSAFEAVFADSASPKLEIDAEVHHNEPRFMVPQFVDQHPGLQWLRQDPRILGVVAALLGDHFEYTDSDGNLYFCDTEWHCDIFSAPMETTNVKLSFYLDPLRGDSGAVRVIPGTNHWQSDYATTLRGSFREIGDVASIYGVEGPGVPSVTIDADPGDLLLWDFRTLHASYFGRPRRRLFTMNFRQLATPNG